MAEVYIFDLYATLIDIHTDESMPSLWKRIAEHYNIYGADWKPAEMKEAYFRLCREEAQKLVSETVIYPEPDLKTVFRRLYEEAPSHHKAEMENRVGTDWIVFTAGMFRTLSRKKLKLYPDTLPVLKELRNRKKKIHLLSNAQHVFTVPEMELCGIYEYFDDIFISSDYGMKKPQKEFMEALLEKHGVNPQDALMIGNDISSDILTAARCGVPSAFINREGYTSAQIRKQMKEHLGNTSYKPMIIMDGSLSAVL